MRGRVLLVLELELRRVLVLLREHCWPRDDPARVWEPAVLDVRRLSVTSVARQRDRIRLERSTTATIPVVEHKLYRPRHQWCFTR